MKTSKCHPDRKHYAKELCQKCYDASRTEYRENNKERIRAKDKAYYEANKEHLKAYGAVYRNANRQYRNDCEKAYRKANKERISLSRKAYRQNNKEKINAQNRAFRNNYKEKIREYYRTYHKNRYIMDTGFKLRSSLRSRLHQAIKNDYKSGSAVRDLGCSIAELKTYLESLFQPGMTWANHGEWHIDHIKPLASFDLTNREELLKACHFTNLQPLWAIDNIRKKDKC